MTSGDRHSVIRAALSAVRDCADTIEAQAGGMLAGLADAPLDVAMRAKAAGLCSALKEMAGRVTFEIALLEAELGDDDTVDSPVVRRLVGLDATMMETLAPLAELADQLEVAAERDPALERAFVIVIEAAGIMLDQLDRARSATAAVVLE